VLWNVKPCSLNLHQLLPLWGPNISQGPVFASYDVGLSSPGIIEIGRFAGSQERFCCLGDLACPNWTYAPSVRGLTFFGKNMRVTVPEISVRIHSTIWYVQISTTEICSCLVCFIAVFLNRRAAARYRDLASIIPGRERFSWNLSFCFLSIFYE
jgi:hypothetical protein